jgi:hypothetical protein
MSYWLIKSEPETYSWDQLIKDKQTRWDGIRNYCSFTQNNEKGPFVFITAIKERNRRYRNRIKRSLSRSNHHGSRLVCDRYKTSQIIIETG